MARFILALAVLAILDLGPEAQGKLPGIGNAHGVGPGLPAARGAAGVPGLHGAAGVPGVHDAAGVHGVHGAAGVPGVHDAAGVHGVHGAAGVPGLHGAAGVHGVHGAAGVPGLRRGGIPGGRLRTGEIPQSCYHQRGVWIGECKTADPIYEYSFTTNECRRLPGCYEAGHTFYTTVDECNNCQQDEQTVYGSTTMRRG